MRPRVLVLLLIATTSACLDAAPEPIADRPTDIEGTWGTVTVLTSAGHQDLAYQVVNGRAMHEGDIDLGDARQLVLFSAATPDLGKRWPGGVVPFFFDPNIAAAGANQTAGIRAALLDLETTIPINFVEYAIEPDFPHIKYRFDGTMSVNSGASGIGMQNDPVSRTVNTKFGTGTNLATISSRYLIQHETMHALGFWHEQSRPDRDAFVWVDSECITEWKSHNFDKHDDAVVSAPYGYASIMHYAATTWCETDPLSTCSATCRTKDDGTCCYPLRRVDGAVDANGVPTIGGSSMSVDDVNAVHLLYSQNTAHTEQDDLFGSAFAAGDIDGDGYADLVVGSPGETVGGKWQAGSVQVYRGTSERLQPWFQFDEGTLGETVAIGERFGAAVAIGNIDGTGRREIAIGAPGEGSSAGAVYIIRQSSGAWFTLVGKYTQASGSAGIPEANEEFGHAVVFADLTEDGSDDLVVGSPFDKATLMGQPQIPGGVYAFDLDANGAIVDVSKLGGSSFLSSQLGSAIDVTDIDRDGHDDLVIGAPTGKLDGVAGGVAVIAQGLTPASSAYPMLQVTAWMQPVGSTAGHRFGSSVKFVGARTVLVGAPGKIGGRVSNYQVAADLASATLQQTLAQVGADDEVGDEFGAALAGGGFRAGGVDVAIGAPGEDNGRGKVVLDDGAIVSGAWTFTLAKTIGPGVPGDVTADGDHLGFALAVADFDGAGSTPKRGDLVMGGPGGGFGLYMPAQSGSFAVYLGSDAAQAPALHSVYRQGDNPVE